jgi:ParB-like chromosome segregation protein Spo0J
MANMVEYRKISELKLHGNNPRFIKDDKFKKLVKSIKDFPEMLEKRPLVIDEDGIILGGNMRFRACLELKLKEVPVIVAKGWTDEQKNEFVIKDNISSGEFDFDVLANEWDQADLIEWGMDEYKFADNSDDINLDAFFQEDNTAEKENKNKIILEYSDEDFKAINEALKLHSGSKEDIFFKLLVL